MPRKARIDTPGALPPQLPSPQSWEVGAIANMCKKASAMAENLISWAEGLSRAPAGGLRLKPSARQGIDRIKGPEDVLAPGKYPQNV